MFYRFFLFFLFVLFFDLTSDVPAKAYTASDAHTAEAELWGKQPEEEKAFETAGLFFSDKPEEVPIRENTPLWLENAISEPEAQEDSPMIAIVIDDLGINRKTTEAVLELPAPITAAFLAYADDLPQQTEKARSNGHELLLHVPMEPANPHFDPGPGALRTDLTADDIREKLDIMLEAFDGYVGINNHMGSKFTSDRKAVGTVIDELKKRNLLFLDSMTSGESFGWKQARDRNVPYAVRDVFLDNARDEKEIMKQLALVEKQALKHHIAVAIGHPHAATVRALSKWMPQAKEKGFVFVPVSSVALIGQEDY